MHDRDISMGSPLLTGRSTTLPAWQVPRQTHSQRPARSPPSAASYTSDIKVDDTGAEFPEGITDRMWDAVGKTEQQLKREHRGETFTKDLTVSPLTPLTAWYIGIAAVPIPERGRPWCKLRIKDSMGNAYEFDY